MRTFIIKPGDLIPIGRAGENQATQIRFDVTGWADTFGAGTYTLVVKRPHEDTAYPVEVTVDGDYVVWTVSNVDTGIAGNASVQLRYVVDGALAKSVIYNGIVGESLDNVVDPPDPFEDLIQRMVDLAERTEAAAESAAGSAASASESAGAATAAKTAAQTAAQTAQTAQGTATQAAQTATQAKDAAQTAQQAAEAAQSAAANSATAASGSATAAAGSATAAAASAAAADASADAAQAVMDSIPDDYSDLSAKVDELEESLYIKGNAVTIQRESQAASFEKNKPAGLVCVESTDKPIFTGTANIIDLLGIAQGTFVDSNSGVTIEISGNEVYMHGTTTAGFRFNIQTGEFYTDSFANHPADLSVFSALDNGYRLCYYEETGYTMPSNVYFGKLKKDGSAIQAGALNGHSGVFWKNGTYLAFYSNGAISNLNVKFKIGLKITDIPAAIADIEGTPFIDPRIQLIESPGYYELDELTWTYDDTVCSVVKATKRNPSLTEGHTFAWFGDSISQLLDLPNLASDLINAPVYDCSFAGAPLTYGDPTMYQPTGFMSLCSQIVTGDFSALSAALTAQQSAGINVTEKLAHLATLQTLDFDNVTDIVVMGGANDFDNDYVNATNFVNGLTDAIDTLLTAYPHLMVYVFSPLWRGDKTEGVSTIPTMPDLVNLIKGVADSYSLPFYDLYHRSGINALTATVYLESDKLHPSDAGDKLLANKCAKFLRSN